MDMESILSLLIAEREKLTKAISALESRAPGRPPRVSIQTAQPAFDAPQRAEKSGKRPWTKKQREGQRERIKAYWAAYKGSARKQQRGKSR